VGREAASIASTLDRVARTLGMDPGARDVLNGVATAMSQLRGVAILNDLPPLAEVLAAVDGAVKLVHATKGPVAADAAGVFDAAAKTLARAAREVVESGRPAASSDESRAFTTALLKTFMHLGDPVPVELLAPADGPASVVTAGRAPAEGTPPPRVELVSQGEFLAAAATELARATSEIQRDLRLFAIGASLKSLIDGDGSSLARALAAFAEAGWWAIGTGAAAAEPERFVEVLSDAAATLRSADRADDPRLAQVLSAHASRLLLRLPYPPPAVPLAPAPVWPPVVSAPVPAPVVAPAPPQPAAPRAPRHTAVRPLPALVPAEGGGLAASWSTLEALVGEKGLAHGSLDEFLAGPAPRASAPARAAAAPAERPVVPIESLAPDEAGVVLIESLLYDGDSIGQRLREVQGELDTALATAGTSAQVRSLLGEVFDLIGIGLHPAR